MQSLSQTDELPAKCMQIVESIFFAVSGRGGRAIFKYSTYTKDLYLSVGLGWWCENRTRGSGTYNFSV